MKSPKAPESASCCPPPPAVVLVLVVVLVGVGVVMADVAADICLDSFRSRALLVGDFASVTIAAEFDCRCGEEEEERVSLTVVDDVVMINEAPKRSRL